MSDDKEKTPPDAPPAPPAPQTKSDDGPELDANGQEWDGQRWVRRGPPPKDAA